MIPYLLSPAGSFASLCAAVDAGADEIYLGGTAFNARIGAANFSESELIRAGGLCRERNIGLHITVNTLVFDREFSDALKYISFLHGKVHPEALIIQDLGLACAVKREFPDMRLHASTQMRINSPLDAPFLRSLGFSRAVLARELPKEDIKAFAATGLETEIFVHGALCVCESGGCLMSSVIGGRSGNRGECAQPCRLPYRGANRFPLSLRDLCLASHITETAELGVTSLKIEGRMKSPLYVGEVTSIYRRLLDERRNASVSELERLAEIFSRGGFTDGYFVSQTGKSMFGFRSEKDKEKTGAFVPDGKKEPSGGRSRAVSPAIPLSEIVADRSALQSPREQLGLVFRFEGGLPSAEFLAKNADRAVRLDIPLPLAGSALLSPYIEKTAVIMPRQIYVSELAEIKKMLSDAKKRGIKHAVVNSFSQITLCEGFFLHGDWVLNIVSRATLAEYCRFPFSSLMLSPESDFTAFHGAPAALEYIGYGRTPLMYTRNCIIKNLGECRDKKLCLAYLTDRTGASFPVIGGFGHRSTVYNSLPGYRLDRRSGMKKSGIGLVTLLFTDEDEKRMEEIISLSSGKEKPGFEYTRR